MELYVHDTSVFTCENLCLSEGPVHCLILTICTKPLFAITGLHSVAHHSFVNVHAAFCS